MADLTTDMLVIGGGPGGASAAIEAADRGLDVVLVDKAAFPREKCCGDGLTTGALRHLDELGFDPETVPGWRAITDVIVRTPAGRHRRFPLPSPTDGGGTFAAVAPRREFDAALLAMAGYRGTDVLQRHELTALQQSDGRVMALAAGPDRVLTIEARHVVAADGMWSPTRKLLGVGTEGYRGDWHAFRQYFRNVTGAAATDLLVWFEPDLLPGYAWSFPVGDASANVGFGILRQSGRSVQVMKDLWPEILSRPHVIGALGPNAEPEDNHRAWPIPARLGQLSFSEGRVLFVGDAVAAADPMTGEGIGQAIETGRLAGRLIAEYGGPATGRADQGREPGRVYETALRRGMVKDHKLASMLSSVLSFKQGAEASVVIAGATKWTSSNFARWLFEDYPRASLLTPGRWHRGLFNSSGPFDGRQSDNHPRPRL